MITYFNELINEYGLATGNTRWPPIHINTPSFTHDQINQIDQVKNMFNTKGYNKLSMYGPYVDISGDDLSFEVLINMGARKVGAKNSQKITKIVL